MVNGHAGLQGDRLADQSRGQTMLALMVAQNPKQVKRIGMRSVLVQNPLIKVGRALHVSGLVKPDRSGKRIARGRDHDMSRLIRNPGRHCPRDGFDRAILAVEIVGEWASPRKPRCETLSNDLTKAAGYSTTPWGPTRPGPV
jgi:hypothetical protein